MAQRHKDAVEIQQNGACNITALSRVLVKAIDECRDENKTPCLDEAVRLILHQMSFVAAVYRLDDDPSEYERCMALCERNTNDMSTHESLR